MAELPPVSDPQIAQILAQNKARRQRAILIFTAVAVVLAIGLGGSGLYFSAQAKKKRNIAYSRVVKCLFGTPLAQGEVPMMRIRANWRARIFTPTGGKWTDTPDEQDANKTKLWPNRCVAEMVAFTDTLKEIGEMKEGDKDLGFYSRELSKQTAGDNWKKVDTYQAAIESFVAEADKAKFEFVDVPTVEAPETLAADPIDKLTPKTNVAPSRLGSSTDEVIKGTTTHLFLPPHKGKPAKLCVTTDGKSLECSDPIKGGMPSEAAGTPWILGVEDGAAPLYAFGWDGGIANGSSVASGVFRSDGTASLIESRKFYVAGGYANKAGGSLLLLKPADKPSGDKFKVGHQGPELAKPVFTDVTLTDWNDLPTMVGLFAEWAVWIDTKNQLLARNVSTVPEGPIQTIGTLPGLPSRWGKGDPMHACRTSSALVFHLPVMADGEPKTLVTFLDSAAGTFSKPQVLDRGSVLCGSDAAYVWGPDFVATCHADGCQSESRGLGKPTGPLHEWSEVSVVLDGTLVHVEEAAGLLRITWDKNKKNVATKVWDGQLKGTVLLEENKVHVHRLIPMRGYALLVVGAEDEEHYVRLDATSAEPATFKEN